MSFTYKNNALPNESALLYTPFLLGKGGVKLLIAHPLQLLERQRGER